MSLTEHYMKKALELARRAEGRTVPNPPVGALIVRDEQILGEGFHPEAGKPHAEIYALAEAGESSRGADVYVTLEPCSHVGRTGPCADALIEAGVRKVYVGTLDPNPRVSGRGVEKLQAAGIEVESGVLEKECRRLIAPFAKHILTDRPFVILKSAVTLDGKTATSTGHSQWISNDNSREMVHRIRDKVDVIMVGIGTVLKDDPRLTTRLPEGEGRDALRLIVDSRLRIPLNAAVLKNGAADNTVIACTSSASPEKVEAVEKLGARVWRIADSDDGVDLPKLMARLGKEGCQSVLLEGGSGLNQGALRAGIVDRVMVFIAPLLVGGSDGYGIFHGAGVRHLGDALALKDVRFTCCGDNILVEGEISSCLPD